MSEIFNWTNGQLYRRSTDSDSPRIWHGKLRYKTFNTNNKYITGLARKTLTTKEKMVHDIFILNDNKAEMAKHIGCSELVFASIIGQIIQKGYSLPGKSIKLRNILHKMLIDLTSWKIFTIFCRNRRIQKSGSRRNNFTGSNE
jgi:hypothetical protein